MSATTDLLLEKQEQERQTRFETFLENKHAQQYHGVNDDMAEDYLSWLEQLDTDELIAYGNEAMK